MSIQILCPDYVHAVLDALHAAGHEAYIVGGCVRDGLLGVPCYDIDCEVHGLSADVLWHWWGYERFDPFFTFGAKGWIGHDRGQVGPKAGIGSFYHLTDTWSIRFDADLTLGVDGGCETLYTLCAGIQRSF